MRTARRMTGMIPKKDATTGTWSYPASEDILEAAGLFTVEHYVKVQRQTIAAFIVERPVFAMCQEGGRRRGSSAARQFWWEQPCDFSEARDVARARSVVAVEIDEEESMDPLG